MHGLDSTLRHAVRSLLRYKLLTVLAVACMGLGIGTCVTLFTALNPWLYRPLPYPAAERLVSVRETLPESGGQWSGRDLLSGPSYLDWQARARSFDSIAAIERTEYNLSAEGEPERVPAARVTASLMSTLGVAPVAGRLFGASEDRPGSAVALVSHSLWQRRLGADPAIVGRALRLDGRLYSVVGVMPERFNFPEYADVWTPLGLEVGGKRDERRLDVVARLREDTSVAQAGSEAAAIAAQIAREHPDSNEGRSAVVWPYIQSFTPPGVVIGMYLVLAAGLFVQLIASANVANLLLVKAMGQRHDTAVRYALGARRSDILRQSLVETLIVSAAGGALGLALGTAGASWVVTASPVQPPTWVRYDVDWRVVAFTIALTAASALAVSLVPALHGRNLVGELKDSGRTSSAGARGRLGRLLTVAELAAALVLLVSASLMVQSFHQRYASDAGVATHGVLTARLALAGDAYKEPSRRAAFADELVRRLQAEPEVVEAGVSSALPFADAAAGGWQSRGIEIEGQPIETGQAAPRAVYFAVSPGYPAAVGLGLRAGRWFSAEDDEQRREVVLVSSSLARRAWGAADALGNRVRIEGGPWLRVVGVVEDVRDAGDATLIGGKPGDQVYVPFRADTPRERPARRPDAVGAERLRGRAARRRPLARSRAAAALGPDPRRVARALGVGRADVGRDALAGRRPGAGPRGPGGLRRRLLLRVAAHPRDRDPDGRGRRTRPRDRHGARRRPAARACGRRARPRRRGRPDTLDVPAPLRRRPARPADARRLRGDARAGRAPGERRTGLARHAHRPGSRSAGGVAIRRRYPTVTGHVGRRAQTVLTLAHRIIREAARAALPPAELLDQLRQGKTALHRRHAALPLPEKVRLVIELQRIVLPLIARQRALRSWERPWEIEP